MSIHIRCAIYTRKSTEEGLEQAFNSLDAQREACEAFVKSQRHEGWQAIADHYDDGGYSGGNMERPALKQLMADIHSGKVNVVVVYKVDRLTRTLTDFAKIIEHFDKYDVSFVSVTQQFNTTTSMGRLTLNVLLSFAQFEREVTGERIRDKVAASKKKGMWMGGTVSLGYEIHDRKLTINEPEAETVRTIFREYLRHSSMLQLQEWLRENNIRSRRGYPFHRGPLYVLLRNPLYAGDIRHKKLIYSGEHPAIIDRETWDKVQAQLDANIQDKQRRVRSTKPGFLAGVIYDCNGARYTPTHTCKNGRRYRYYISQALIGKAKRSDSPSRIPAHDVEKAVIERILELLPTPKELLGILNGNLLGANTAPASGLYSALIDKAADTARNWSKSLAHDRIHFLKNVIERVVVHPRQLEIRLRVTQLIQMLLYRSANESSELTPALPGSIVTVTCPFRHVMQGRAQRLLIGGGKLATDASRQAILRSMARTQLWRLQFENGEVTSLNEIIRREGIDASWAKKIFPLAFLSPANTEAILNTSTDMTLKALLASIHMDWNQQRIS